jgi:adhesin transport system membrane fusion protein
MVSVKGHFYTVIIVINTSSTATGISPLLRLNLATSGVNKEELAVRLDGQILIRSRLEAEANATPLKFPADVAKRRPTQAQNEKRAYQAELRELQSTQASLAQQVRQKRHEVQELQAKSRALSNNLKLGKERLGMSKDLLASGLTPKLEHLQLQADVENVEGELGSIRPSIRRASSAVEEAKQRIQQELLRFRRDAQTKLGEAEQAIGRLTELLAEANEQGGRAEIKSPTAVRAPENDHCEPQRRCHPQCVGLNAGSGVPEVLLPQLD